MLEPLGVKNDEIIHEHLKLFNFEFVKKIINKHRHVEIG